MNCPSTPDRTTEHAQATRPQSTVHTAAAAPCSPAPSSGEAKGGGFLASCSLLPSRPCFKLQNSVLHLACILHSFTYLTRVAATCLYFKFLERRQSANADAAHVQRTYGQRFDRLLV
jgi:hypothetical protein